MMTVSNKKIIIGFFIAFVIGLNIYNIPLKANDEDSASIQSVSMTDVNSEFNAPKVNQTINQYLDDPVDFTKYKKVIFTFWATWCPSCRRENQIFNDIVKQSKELLIIAISLDKDQSALDKYLQDNPLSFPVVHIKKDIALYFDDIMAVPTHFIYDTKTKNIQKSMGLLDESELKQLIKEPI